MLPVGSGNTFMPTFIFVRNCLRHSKLVKKVVTNNGKPTDSTDYIDRVHSMYVEACAEEDDLDKITKFDVRFANKTVKSLKKLIARHAKLSALAKKAKNDKKNRTNKNANRN